MFVNKKEFEKLKAQVEKLEIMLNQTINHVVFLEQELREKEKKEEPSYFG